MKAKVKAQFLPLQDIYSQVHNLNQVNIERRWVYKGVLKTLDPMWYSRLERANYGLIFGRSWSQVFEYSWVIIVHEVWWSACSCTQVGTTGNSKQFMSQFVKTLTQNQSFNKGSSNPSPMTSNSSTTTPQKFQTPQRMCTL